MGPNLSGLANDQERRCFDFFQTRTAGQLSGFFDTTFWKRLILRATHHEAAIKHAVLALGSLHERFEEGDKSILQTIWSKGEGGFALTQYNLAIQQLVKPVGNAQRSVDVCLIACILFACFEVRHSQWVRSLMSCHLHQGCLGRALANQSPDVARSPWLRTFSHHEWRQDTLRGAL